MIHYTNYKVLGSAYIRKFSEKIAYEASAGEYFKAGRLGEGYGRLVMSWKLGFSNLKPPIQYYNLPDCLRPQVRIPFLNY